jgi:hypothetical protein
MIELLLLLLSWLSFADAVAELPGVEVIFE